MSIQQWAIRKEQRDHQRQTGQSAMMKGEAQRARDIPSRVVTRRDVDQQV